MSEPWWFGAVVTLVVALGGYVRWQTAEHARLTERLLEYLEKDGERRERAIAAQGQVAAALAVVGVSLDKLTAHVGRVCKESK